MIYCFSNPETGEIVEVYQRINDVHEYYENGIKFDRVFTSPNAQVKNNTDPFKPQGFMDSTRNGGTMDDLFKRSAELSARRAEIAGGVDPVKAAADRAYIEARPALKEKQERKAAGL